MNGLLIFSGSSLKRLPIFLLVVDEFFSHVSARQNVLRIIKNSQIFGKIQPNNPKDILALSNCEFHQQHFSDLPSVIRRLFDVETEYGRRLGYIFARCLLLWEFDYEFQSARCPEFGQNHRPCHAI